MTSEAQITANRRNAEKSTGPKTEEGRAVAARNSLQHGLTAQKIVCFDEKWQDFLSAHEALRDALAPGDAVEEQLVERIALCAWRLRRASRAEADMINAYRDPKPRIHDTAVATVFDLASGDMTALSRYEMALDRAFKSAYVMLERRQARRRGEHVPAPAQIDVSGIDTLDPGALILREKVNFDETNPISPEKSASQVLEGGAEGKSQAV